MLTRQDPLITGTILGARKVMLAQSSGRLWRQFEPIRQQTYTKFAGNFSGRARSVDEQSRKDAGVSVTGSHSRYVRPARIPALRTHRPGGQFAVNVVAHTAPMQHRNGTSANKSPAAARGRSSPFTAGQFYAAPVCDDGEGLVHDRQTLFIGIHEKGVGGELGRCELPPDVERQLDGIVRETGIGAEKRRAVRRRRGAASTGATHQGLLTKFVRRFGRVCAFEGHVVVESGVSTHM